MSDIENEWKSIEENLKGKQKQTRFKKLNKEHSLSEKEQTKIEAGYFDLLKNCTILAGTIFASSIALATGKPLNDLFIVGELFLLISTMVGALYLWAQLRGKETFYFLMTAWRLESDLSLNKELMEDFEREQIQKSAEEYKRLSEKKSLSYHLLKLIKVDWLPTIFFTSLFIGLLCIWMSLFINTNMIFKSSNQRENMRFNPMYDTRMPKYRHNFQ